MAMAKDIMQHRVAGSWAEPDEVLKIVDTRASLVPAEQPTDQDAPAQGEAGLGKDDATAGTEGTPELGVPPSIEVLRQLLRLERYESSVGPRICQRGNRPLPWNR
jgi:hypothetical protein